MRFNRIGSRMISAALVLVLIFSLAGCGAGRDVDADTGAFGQTGAPSVDPGINDQGTDDYGLEPPDDLTPGSLAQMLESGTAVQYQRVACMDPELGCEAVRSVAPVGWQVGGQAYWNMQSGSYPATIDFYIYSPDMTEQVGAVSTMAYADASDRAAEGGFDDVALAPVYTFVSAEHYAQAFMSEYLGTPMQLLDVRYPEGADLSALQTYQQNVQQSTDQIYAEWTQMNQQYGGSAQAQVAVYGAYVDMRFERDGKSYKVRVCCVIEHITSTYSFAGSQYMAAYSTTDRNWSTPMFYYYIAEESRFDESGAVAAAFADNLFVNEQFIGAVAEAASQTRQQQWQSWADQLSEITQYCQQAAQSYSQSHAQGYSSSSGSLSGNSDSVINGWTNAITGNSYYEGADGAPVLLDSSYNHTYHDGSGGFIQSNDPLTGYSEATDLGTMG